MASIFKTATGWRAQVRLAGKPASSKVLPTKNEAVRWARDEEHRLMNSGASGPNTTFAELLTTYLELLTRKSPDKTLILRSLLPWWGGYRISEINTATITSYAVKRTRDGVHPSTIMKELVYLGVALQHGGVLINNREAQVARLELGAAIKSLRHAGIISDSVQRDRRPTDEEIGRLVWWFERRRSDIPMADMMLFAIATAMRLGEITGPGGIRFEDVNWQNRTVLVRGRKDPRKPGGRDEIVPLLTGHFRFQNGIIDPLQIIKKQSVTLTGKGPVFVAQEKTVTKIFSQACKDCAVPDLRFHDLRHDGISRMFEAEYDIPQVAAVSGHKTWKNLQRYTHLRPSAVQRSNLVLT